MTRFNDVSIHEFSFACFKNGAPGDIFIQKAPSCKIDLQKHYVISEKNLITT